MELGAGLVDVLRIGTGVQQGTFGGVAQDALRLLVVLGPTARAGGILARYAHTSALRLALTTADVTGPCTFTAVNNSLSIVGAGAHNMFVTAREAARALGKALSALPKTGADYELAAWIDDLVPFLVRNGVRLRSLGIPTTIDDVVRAAGAHDGVVIFAIEWTNLVGKIERHSMIAVRTIRGVKFADYGGRFISNLAELEARANFKTMFNSGYRIATQGLKGNAMLVSGMELAGALERYGREVMRGGMLLLEGARALQAPDGVDLALPVAAAAAIEPLTHEPEVLKTSFAAYKAHKGGRPMGRLPAVTLRGAKNGAPKSDQLTGVQYRLNAAGFGAGPVDGKNGPRTDKAVRAFQTAYSLQSDGIPGPKTQNKLVEVCGY
jgi:hypothetical protein